MSDPFVIGVVDGVTPDRWVRVWRDRMPGVPLLVVPVGDVADALRSRAHMVFARLPLEGIGAEAVHTIVLWEETPVVVVARDHAAKALDAVTEADLVGEELHPGWTEDVLDLVAAGHGIARMPQSVFRATGRRDLVARPVSDAPVTRVGLVWLRSGGGELVDEFVGIVRGRSANSSRGTAPAAAPASAPTPAAPVPNRDPKPTRRRTANRTPARRHRKR